MENYMTIVTGLILAVTLASIFAISVVTLLIIIKRAQFFSGRSGTLVAVSLLMLFSVALYEFFVGLGDAYHITGSDSGIKAVHHSSLHKVALVVAAAVVFSQVPLLANKISLNEKPEATTKKSERSIIKPKSPGRPKKAESERPPTPPKSGGKEKNVAKISTGIERTTTT